MSYFSNGMVHAISDTTKRRLRKARVHLPCVSIDLRGSALSRSSKAGVLGGVNIIKQWRQIYCHLHVSNIEVVLVSAPRRSGPLENCTHADIRLLESLARWKPLSSVRVPNGLLWSGSEENWLRTWAIGHATVPHLALNTYLMKISFSTAMRNEGRWQCISTLTGRSELNLGVYLKCNCLYK